MGYEVVGNPALKPEHARSYNVGLDYRPANWSAFSLNLFRNELTDMIQTQLQSANTAGSLSQHLYVNIASATTQGIEASWRLRPLSGLTLEPGYTFTDAQDLQKGRPLSGRAQHLGSLVVQYQHDPLGLTAFSRATFSGRRPFYTDGNGNVVEQAIWTPQYATLDLRVSKTVTSQVSLFVQGQNLLDAWDPLYLPLQPRTILGGVSARF
ncbi:Colicin I receptor precursor [compost metagenome]